MNSDSYIPFYGWLIIAGLILFGGFLLWQNNLITTLLTDDQTRISSIILILFIGTSAYLGWCSFKISQQNQFSKIGADRERNKGWASEYRLRLNQLSQSAETAGQAESLHSRLVSQVHGLHYHGWFVADILLRLGLIGTVVGFVIMLSSVNQLQADEVHALKQLMSSMGSGMRVALYTTLTGLGSAILLSIQCHWLDRCADSLVDRIIELGFNPINTS